MNATGPEAGALRLATETIQAAYEEGMRQHGMPSSTIALVSSHARKNLAALDDPDGDLPDLEELRSAVETASPHVKTSLRRGPDGRLLLHINNPDIGGRFCEDVSVREVRHFLWSWGETIAPVGTPSAAAARIVHVLATSTH